jgi:hypothetical protein
VSRPNNVGYSKPQPVKSKPINVPIPKANPSVSDKRNYDKPWQVPKKEKKEATTFLEYHYPDGVGPDVDLI